MVDPVRTLVGALERELVAVPGVELLPGAGPGAPERFRATFGSDAPAGLLALLAAHDGGSLPGGSRLLSLSEAETRFRELSNQNHTGLWPFLDHGGRRYALDAQGTSADGEWPVVEVGAAGLDRVGTSLLRFLHVLAAELTATAALGEAAAGSGSGGGTAEATSRSQVLARERCRRDPGLADHWLELAQLQEEGGEDAAVDATLASAVRAATPPTPA
jgi:hypothetical protein